MSVNELQPRKFIRPTVAVGLLLSVLTNMATLAADPPVFSKQQLTDKFYCEGAHFADFDRDGKVDIVSGPYWYSGPTFESSHEIYPVEAFQPKGYSRNFLCFTTDVNRDGWADVVVCGMPGEETFWYQNPKNEKGHWKRHVAFAVTDNESPWLIDINADRTLDLVFHTGGYYGYATVDASAPEQPWKFHRISKMIAGGRFQHGLGVGDVNNDGRTDILHAKGWFEQPASLEGDPEWRHHEFPFAPTQGGSQMHVYDFDGDGDNDVLTSLQAHGYGLSWFEASTSGDEINFVEHKILGDKPEDNPYGVCFTQMHSIDLIDFDGDGLKDIVTGKRFWAHNGNDPGGNDPAVLYWFQTVQKTDGSVDFVPHKIDDDSGVGTQVTAGDLNGDDQPDIVVGNKKGTFVFLQD